MFSSIYFCADGILRGMSNEDKPLIPITLIQKHKNLNNDFEFWVSHWKHTVHFEKGLTVSAFFQCLEPWIDFFSLLTSVDMNSYLKEMRKPCDIDKQSKLSYISIGYETLLEPEMEFLEKLDHKELWKIIDSGEKDKKLRLAQLTGFWKQNHRSCVNGFVENDERRYAFSTARPEAMANIPLILNTRETIYFSSHIANRFREENDNLVFAETFPSVIEHNGQRDLLVHKASYSLREVVELFLSAFESSPEAARAFEAKLYQRFEQSKAEIDRKMKEKADKINKVIPINKNSKTEESNNKDEKVSFTMTSGFIADLNQFSKNERDLWDDLLELSHKENVILKIGKVETQVAPDIRLFYNQLLKEDYIKPSESKLI